MLLNHALHAGALPLELFLGDVARRKPPRVPGTAVFMTSSNDGVPVVLLHHLKHNKVLHEQVILMSVVTHEVPEVKASERVTVEKLEHGFYPRHGALRLHGDSRTCRRSCSGRARPASRRRPNETTFYLGRERIIISDGEAQAGHAPRAGRRRASAHGALAQEALRRHVPQRPLGHGVLRHSAESRRGAWERRSSSRAVRLSG